MGSPYHLNGKVDREGWVGGSVPKPSGRTGQVIHPGKVFVGVLFIQKNRITGQDISDSPSNLEPTSFSEGCDEIHRNHGSGCNRSRKDGPTGASMQAMPWKRGENIGERVGFRME